MAKGVYYPAERFVDDVEYARQQREELQSRIHTATPVVFEQNEPKQNTAQVNPALKLAKVNDDGKVEWVQIPTIKSAPLLQLGGGGMHITIPVRKGDEGLAIFASRAIDNWWAKGGIQNQDQARMHSVTDAFVIPGFASQPNKLDNVNTTSMQMRTTDGKTNFEFDPTSGGKMTMTSPQNPMTVQGKAFDTKVETSTQKATDNIKLDTPTTTATGNLNVAKKLTAGQGLQVAGGATVSGGLQVSGGITGAGGGPIDLAYLPLVGGQITGPLYIASTVNPVSSTTASSFSGRIIRFMQDAGDESNAGTIAYRIFDGAALNILGAGTASGSRKIVLWDNVSVTGAAAITGNLTVAGDIWIGGQPIGTGLPYLPLVGGILSGPLAVTGFIQTQGAGAIYVFADRTGGANWGWYSTGNVARLNSASNGDRFWVDLSGNGSFTGSLTVTTALSVGGGAGTGPMLVVQQSRPASYFWDKATIACQDGRVFAQGVGGGITFMGKFNTAGNWADYGGVQAYKANPTDGEYTGYLDIWARGTGGAIRFFAGETIGGGQLAQFTPSDWQSTQSANFTPRRWRFAVNAGDNGAAGSIDYRGYDGPSLSIVGAGTAPTGRKITLWDDVQVQNNLNVTGSLALGGLLTAGAINSPNISAIGVSAWLGFANRTSPGAGDWGWYASDGKARLFNGADRLWIDTDGSIYSFSNIIMPNGNWLFCRDSAGTPQVIASIQGDNAIYIGGGERWMYLRGSMTSVSGNTIGFQNYMGGVGGTGGPCIYGDSNWILVKPGSGNGGLLLYDYNGATRAEMRTDGTFWAMGVGNPALGQFRMMQNNVGNGYGSAWYNDGTTTYLLLTNLNDSQGGMNALRPFLCDMSTGKIVMQQGLQVNGAMSKYYGGVQIFNGGGGGSNLNLYDDGNSHIESSTVLWLNWNGVQIQANGGFYANGGIAVGAGFTANCPSTLNGQLNVNGTTFLTQYSYAQAGLRVWSGGAGSDPLEVRSDGGHARTYYHVAGVRIWTCGAINTGVFYIADESAGARRMQIDLSGNVLIDNSLTVGGNVQANGSTGCNGLWWGNNGGWWWTGSPVHTDSDIQCRDCYTNSVFVGGLQLYAIGADWVYSPKGILANTNGLYSYTNCHADGVGTFAGGVTCSNGRINSQGGDAGFFFSNRAAPGPGYFGWFASQGLARFVSDGADRVYFNSVGDIYPYTPSTATCGNYNWWNVISNNFSPPSDPRLKRDIEPAPPALARVRDIPAVTYRWRDGIETKKRQYGWLSTDVRRVMGDEWAGVIHNPMTGMDGIALNQVTALLWKAVQELAAEVETLKARLH